MNKKRGSFSSRIGFVLAAAGSAVGLGNLWRFPYLAAKYGGGTFLLIYIILAVTFGYSLMTAEITLGRSTRLRAVGAYDKLNKKFHFIGLLTCLVPIIIVPYYGVIGGWIVKYMAVFIKDGAAAAATDNYFTNFITNPWQPFFFLVVFITITAVIVSMGVKGGIEKASTLMMPLLIVLSIIIALYSATRPGAWEGVKYYFTPHLSDVSPNTLLGAMGQMFYSMSLAMGIMVTYGSYMPDGEDIEKSVGQIELFDTGVALLAGLMIIPAVFAFSGGDPDTLQAGPSLMFITIPKVFDSMGFGTFAGILFFLLVLFAAVTSSIALTESAVSTVEDELKWSRKKSTVIVGFIMIILGTLSCLGYGPLSFVKIIGMQFLDFFDFLTNSVMMPIAALMTSLFVSKVVGVDRMEEEIRHGESKFRRKKIFVVMIKYLCPIFAIIILVSSVANAFGWISM